MLHIVKQYRKMLFSFLENNFDRQEGTSFSADKSGERKPLNDIGLPEWDKMNLIPSTIDSITNSKNKVADIIRSDVSESTTKLSEKTNESIISNFDEKVDSKNPTRVKALQAVLVALGYRLQGQNNGIDGRFGKTTKLALEMEKEKRSKSELQSTVIPEQTPVVNVDATSGNDKVKESNDTLDYNATLDLLSDLNSDSDLYDQNVLDEKNLRTTISQLSNGNKSILLSIYENVTGKRVQEINKDNVKDFHENFVFNIRFMQGLGYSGGAHALLSGKMEDFVKKVPKGAKLEVSNFDKLSPGVQNAIGALVSTGVLVLTQGIVAASREVKQYDGNEVVERIEKSKEGELLSGLKQFLTYIARAIVGRKLSVSFGEDDTINVEKFEESITKFATGVLELKFDGTDENLPEGLSKEKYNEILKLSRQYKLDIKKPEDKKLLQGILIQDFILSEGIKRQGTDWKFTLGLLFIGFHRDEIGGETVPLELNEQQAEVERKLTRKPLDSKVLESIGITVNKVNGKFEHILPKEGSMIRLLGDDREFPIKEIYVPEGVTMETLRSSDIKYDFHFSFVGGRGKDYYVLALTPSTSTSSGATGDVGPKQNISETINLREGKEVLSNKDLSQVLFDIVGHRVNFGKLAKAISRGDLELANKELNILAEQYKNNKEFSSYINQLKQNISSFSIWDSYMSGNKETRKERSPKFDMVRTKEVIKAEVALAGVSGFPVPGSENDFRVPGEYKSKQISEVLSGQEITSVQFMTPLDRNNKKQSRASLHRVSVVDGSFAISEKYQEVNDQVRKESIVDGLLKSSHESRAIKNQLVKLNDFLSEHGKKVEEADYIKFLKSGNLEDLKVPGLKIQKGKETRFLEARAMVAGNVCLNATYAIAYPAFEFEGGNKQKVDSVSSVDYTAATNIELSEGKESGIGFSTPGTINKLVNKGGSGGPKGSAENTSTGGTGSQIPGGVPPTPNTAAGAFNSITNSTGTGFKLVRLTTT